MEKALPHNIEIEQAILGIYLGYPEKQKKIENIVNYDDFHATSHIALYKYIYTYKELNNDVPVTHILALLDFLSKQDGALKRCGGYDYIASLPNSMSTSAGLDSLISALKDLSHRRRLIIQCESIIRCCYDDYNAEIGDLMGDMDIILESVNRRLSYEIREWVDQTTGWFTVTSCDNELKIVTKRDKNNRRQILSRLRKDGIIEVDPTRNGFFRRVENAIFEDWKNASSEPVKFRLPFAMDRYVEMYAGDLILYAGTKSSGKTALAIETIKLNMHDFETFYHSSELRKETFRMRLSKSKEVDVNNWEVKFSNGLTILNAPDRVQPNGLNVFDYLEDAGEAYKLPDAIAKIHRKLDSGVGVICMQRNKDKEYAVGGAQTLAKINFACNLTSGRPNNLIVKECKAFKNGINPYNYTIGYKIVDGITLIPDGIFGPESLTWRE